MSRSEEQKPVHDGLESKKIKSGNIQREIGLKILTLCRENVLIVAGPWKVVWVRGSVHRRIWGRKRGEGSPKGEGSRGRAIKCHAQVKGLRCHSGLTSKIN